MLTLGLALKDGLLVENSKTGNSFFLEFGEFSLDISKLSVSFWLLQLFIVTISTVLSIFDTTFSFLVLKLKKFLI